MLPSKKKHTSPKADYVPVSPTSSSTTAPVSKQSVDNDAEINTGLSYTNEQLQRSNQSDSLFSEFESEPRNISPRETRPQPNDEQGQVIKYAQITNAEVNVPSDTKKESDDTSTISSLDEPLRRQNSAGSARRSYIPPSYAKHSPPEVQARQKAVNEELNERVSCITSDF